MRRSAQRAASTHPVDVAAACTTLSAARRVREHHRVGTVPAAHRAADRRTGNIRGRADAAASGGPGPTTSAWNAQMMGTRAAAAQAGGTCVITAAGATADGARASSGSQEPPKNAGNAPAQWQTVKRSSAVARARGRREPRRAQPPTGPGRAPRQGPAAQRAADRPPTAACRAGKTGSQRGSSSASSRHATAPSLAEGELDKGLTLHRHPHFPARHRWAGLADEWRACSRTVVARGQHAVAG